MTVIQLIDGQNCADILLAMSMVAVPRSPTLFFQDPNKPRPEPTLILQDGLENPMGMDIDSRGNVYIADSVSGSIKVRACSMKMYS